MSGCYVMSVGARRGEREGEGEREIIKDWKDDNGGKGVCKCIYRRRG